MAEMGHWNEHQFIVSPDLIRGWSGLTIKASCETKDKDYQGKKYVSHKKGNAASVSLTVGLNAFVGCDVRKEAMKFLDEAQNGEKAYFYVGEEKLVPYELMLTEATVNEILISPGGTWIKADVALTLKQASQDDRDPKPSPKAVIWAGKEKETGGGGTGKGNIGGGSAVPIAVER